MDWLREAERARKEFYTLLAQADTPERLENIRILFMGRRGKVTRTLRMLAELSIEERRRVGEVFNRLKEECEQKIDEASNRFSSKSERGPSFDVTLPGKPFPRGRRHPLTILEDEIRDIFVSLGFEVATGPDVEDDYHNFTALNIPDEHPAREMWDTFYLQEKEQRLLRTHTSPVQIRIMEKSKPPLAVISPGKCYRRDAVDARHSPVFHQIEGLWVDKGITFAHLKGVLEYLVKRLFGPEATLRLRPSFFPFTEPSCEVDLDCLKCRGKGCEHCGFKGYLEVLGAGRVHPQVFRNAGYDAEVWSGLAFGLGLERIAMVLYGIGDIRLFLENDLKFLRSFL